MDYLHIGGYNPRGIHDFLRGYYGALERDGLIIDQRFNGGGITSDTLIEMLMRRPIYYYQFREGAHIPMPLNPAPMTKVLLINEWNGSAAETFAFMFKLAGLGPTVGGRTVGAGIGPYSYQPRLIDGGVIQVPNRGAFDPAGDWGIENKGVSPDLEIPIMPAEWKEGRDLRLEAAIRLALERIERQPKHRKKQPAFPVYP